MSAERPRLTVLLVTYNHQQHIRRAVDSLLNQRLPESFRVIVADDGSTDCTRQIIAAAFAERGSDAPPLQFLDFSANLGITQNYRRAFKACETEYVAILEGDDYWISPNKLSLQIEFLDHHWECAAVSANYLTCEERRRQFVARFEPGPDFHYVDARYLIADNIIGNFSTCMYRTSALHQIPPLLFEGTVYDWGINIAVGRDALIGFLRTPLSVYRLHGGGTWGSLAPSDRLHAQREAIDAYNKAFDYIFDEEFKILKMQLDAKLAQLSLGRFARIPVAEGRPWLPRLGAILYACIPPFVVFATRWSAQFSRNVLLPPILEIAVRKIYRRIMGPR